MNVLSFFFPYPQIFCQRLERMDITILFYTERSTMRNGMFMSLNFSFLIGNKDFQTGVDLGWIQIENRSSLLQNGQIDFCGHDCRWERRNFSKHASAEYFNYNLPVSRLQCWNNEVSYTLKNAVGFILLFSLIQIMVDVYTSKYIKISYINVY